MVSRRATASDRRSRCSTAASCRTSATSAGCCAWTSWSAGRNQCTAPRGSAASAAVHRGLLVRRPGRVTGVRRQEQHRRLDRRRSAVDTSCSHRPRRTSRCRSKLSQGATVPSSNVLEVGQRTLDAAVGPVRVAVAQPPLDLGPGRAGQPGRRQGHGTVLPAGEPPAQIDDAAVDRGDHADRVGMAVGQLHHDVAAPRLTGHGGALPAELVDQQGHVVGHGGHVVAVVGLVAAAVAPQVDRGHRVAQLGQRAGHAVPQPGVGGQAVDEEEGGTEPYGEGGPLGRGLRQAHVERDAGGERSRADREHAPSGVPCSAVTSTGRILVVT